MSSPALSQAAAGTGHIRLLGAAALLLSVYGAALTLLGPVMPLAASDLGLTPAQTGLLASAQFTGYLSLILVSGILADRYGRKGVLVVGTALFAAGSAGVWLAHAFGGLLAALVLVGAGGAAINVAASALFADLMTRRDFALNLSRIFPSLGTVVMPLTVAWLTTGGIGWRAVYGALVLASLTGLWAAAPRPFPASSAGLRLDWGQVRLLAGSPPFRRAWLVCLLYMGGEIGVWGRLVPWLQASRQLDVTAANGWLSLFWVSLLLGRVATPWSAARWGNRRVAGWSAAACGAGVLAFAGAVRLGAPLWATGLLLGPVGFAMGFTLPCLLSYATAFHPQVTGTALGAMMAAFSLGAVLFPPLGGWLEHRLPTELAVVGLPAVALALQATIILGMPPPERPAGQGAQGPSALSVNTD